MNAGRSDTHTLWIAFLPSPWTPSDPTLLAKYTPALKDLSANRQGLLDMQTTLLSTGKLRILTPAEQSLLDKANADLDSNKDAIANVQAHADAESEKPDRVVPPGIINGVQTFIYETSQMTPSIAP